MRKTRWSAATGCAAALVLMTACAGDGESAGAETTSASPTTTASSTTAATTAPAPTTEAPRTGIYAYTTPADMSPAVADIPARVYVPNSDANTLTVIDPATKEIIGRYNTGRMPHHVVPSWDLSTLWINNTQGNSLTRIDPRTGEPGESVPVEDPYNLYYTLDGSQAIVVAERFQRLDFRDPNTWELIGSVNIGHSGPNHLDFSPDGSYLLIGCEFSGWIVKVDVASRQVVGEMNVGGEPIDIRLSPDGTRFYAANQSRGGVMVIDPDTMTETKFIPTGRGTHGIYPSRDGKVIYATNRLSGSVSVIDTETDELYVTWNTGSSPDMGGVSPDGNELWLSGRYNSEVIVIDTRTGEVTHRIKTGAGAHGLSFFPQPGRFSLGHTGNYR